MSLLIPEANYHGVVDIGGKFAAGVTAITVNLRKNVSTGVVDT